MFKQSCMKWVVLLWASGVAVASQAQHVHSAPDLPVLVDGAKTPDRDVGLEHPVHVRPWEL